MLQSVVVCACVCVCVHCVYVLFSVYCLPSNLDASLQHTFRYCFMGAAVGATREGKEKDAHGGIIFFLCLVGAV